MNKSIQAPLLTVYVTNHCNLNCLYCMRSSNSKRSLVDKELSTIALKNIMMAAKEQGYIRIKFSSEWGEPLLRMDLEELIECASKLSFSDISLSTNGTMLHGRIKKLYEAGLHRVCISLDTLKPAVYRKITGKDAFNDVINEIDKAVEFFGPEVKINMVVINGVNNSEIKNMINWTGQRGVILQLIEVVGKDQNEAGLFFDLDPVVESLSDKALFVSVDKQEKVMTLISDRFHVQIRQSRKWPKYFYKNERMIIHPDGEIGFWLNQYTRCYAVSNDLSNSCSLIGCKLNKTKELPMNQSEIRDLVRYGNRKMVS